MLTFKEYLTEIFDKPYPFVHTKTVHYGNTSDHQYHIMTPDNKKYKVHITHDKNTGESVLGFENHRGEIELTGTMRHQAHGIISAVANAAKHHVMNTPTVKHVTFEGFKDNDNNDTGRNRLYKAITSKLGGITKDASYYTAHKIPADNIRKAA